MLLTTLGLPQYRDELRSELHIPFIDGFIAAIPRPMNEKSIRKYRESFEPGQVA